MYGVPLLECCSSTLHCASRILSWSSSNFDGLVFGSKSSRRRFKSVITFRATSASTCKFNRFPTSFTKVVLPTLWAPQMKTRSIVNKKCSSWSITSFDLLVVATKPDCLKSLQILPPFIKPSNINHRPVLINEAHLYKFVHRKLNPMWFYFLCYFPVIFPDIFPLRFGKQVWKLTFNM